MTETSPSDDAAKPFRCWHLVGFTLTGLVVLTVVASMTDPAVFGWVYAAGLVAWPTRWRFLRNERDRSVWWLLVVWPVVPFTFVGMAVWFALDVASSF